MLVPPPNGTLPPLVMAWPPISASASTRITEQPASRATIAAGMPVAPAPTTTTSASRSHRVGTGIESPFARGAMLLPREAVFVHLQRTICGADQRCRDAERAGA